MSWKPIAMVVSPSKVAQWAEKDDWEWKKPFQELKLSTIRSEDKWRLLLVFEETETDIAFAMCDGRFQVEIVYDELKE